jgi:hypothetical protein
VAGYKTGQGIERALWAQFHPLEEALVAMGVGPGRWSSSRPTTRSRRRAHRRARPRVDKVCIWTPDKDLAQCVRGDRVVQIDRRGKTIRDARACARKFGVRAELIPDYLALVGDAADGYRALSGSAAVGARRL